MVGCRSVQVGLVKWACSPSRSCSGPRVIRQSVGLVSFGSLGVAVSLVPGRLLTSCERNRLAELERRALAWRLT